MRISNAVSGGSPSPLRRSFRKKTVKVEDDHKECPHCRRKFGPKV